MASSWKANNCAVCSKQVFLFEDRVKTKDLEEQEQTACSTLISKNRPEFQKLLETNEAILCMSCYRKVKASKESGQLEGEFRGLIHRFFVVCLFVCFYLLWSSQTPDFACSPNCYVFPYL